MITNKVVALLAGTFLLGNSLMPIAAVAETRIRQDDQLISVQAQDESLGSLLDTINKSSGITFSYSVAIGEQQLSTQVSAATWEEALKKLLVEYSTVFIWDASGKLTSVNLLRPATPRDNTPVLTPLPLAKSGPPIEQYDSLDSGTSATPPNAAATNDEPGPPVNHLAGAGPPDDELPDDSVETTNRQGSMSGLFNALKIRKALPQQTDPQ
ncbi:MAG: hypothetical protein P1U54_14680 [Immundisolibacteraceae bacterium]|jgi:hypothetical protein|nr:hypothetical protein [Immundisolibacteraceae bacterium]